MAPAGATTPRRVRRRATREAKATHFCRGEVCVVLSYPKRFFLRCYSFAYRYCHPTGAGYELMAGVWANALLPVLKDMAASATTRAAYL